MNFTLKAKRPSGARLGIFSFEPCYRKRKLDENGHSEKNDQSTTTIKSVMYETPMFFVHSRNASIPHITWEVADNLSDDNLPLLIAMPEIANLKEVLDATKQNLKSFANIDCKRPVFSIIQDPVQGIKTGINDKHGVSVWSTAGKHHFDLKSYLALQEVLQVDGFQILCDNDTPKDASKKRLNYTVTRTIDYLEAFSENSPVSEMSRVFGTVVGGFDLKLREESARKAADCSVAGYIIEGFHQYGLETIDLDMGAVSPVLKIIIDNLPEDKPKAMFGMLNLDKVKQLIEEGIDIFDSSYVSYLTENSTVLLLDNNESIGHHLIKIDDVSFKDDHSLLSKYCSCYVCKQAFTKAYINHLLETKEMLGSVLLMLHNLHQFSLWFRNMRIVLSKNE